MDTIWTYVPRVQAAEALSGELFALAARFTHTTKTRLDATAQALFDLAQEVVQHALVANPGAYVPTSAWYHDLNLRMSSARGQCDAAESYAGPYTRLSPHASISFVNLPQAVRTGIQNLINGAAGGWQLRNGDGAHHTDAFSTAALTPATSSTREYSEGPPHDYRWTRRAPLGGWWNAAFYYSPAHGAGQYTYRLVTGIPGYAQHP
jgi:hypothetical protein